MSDGSQADRGATAGDSITFPARGAKAEVEGGLAFQPAFGGDGLIPAVVTDDASGEVLMFAWMNAEALARTIGTREAHFWSRSRGALWRKGEESGNVLRVEALLTDCDQDVVWVRVRVQGSGVACHTGRRSCFYRAAPLGADYAGRLIDEGAGQPVAK